MKNLFFILIFTFVTFGFCSAQQTEGTLQLGISGGPSYTFFRNARMNLRDAKGDLGGSAGFSAQYQRKGFFLKTNLLYEYKGIRYNAGRRIDFECFGPGCDAYRYAEYNAAEIKAHFITLPVLIGTHIKGTGIFVNAGLYIGMSTWETSSSELYGTETKFNPELDFGVAAGFGYARPISQSFGVNSELRHNFGLRGVQNNTGLNSTSLLLGIQYTLSGR